MARVVLEAMEDDAYGKEQTMLLKKTYTHIFTSADQY